MHSLLQLSERSPCHIWLVGRMKFASLEAHLDGGQGLLVDPILFSPSLSGRSPDMTEILLTRILSFNSVNQSICLYECEQDMLKPVWLLQSLHFSRSM